MQINNLIRCHLYQDSEFFGFEFPKWNSNGKVQLNAMLIIKSLHRLIMPYIPLSIKANKMTPRGSALFSFIWFNQTTDQDNIGNQPTGELMGKGWIYVFVSL